MPKRTIVALATAWGPKHGGINSFNCDFLKALGVACHDELSVLCVVARASEAEIEDARNSFVELRPFKAAPQGEQLVEAEAREIVQLVGDAAAGELLWIGHDVSTGRAAVEAAAQTNSRAALLNHMSYKAYKAYQSTAAAADEKSKQQRAIFKRAQLRFSVGPLLRDELSDLTGEKPHMLVPGLPDIEPAAPANRWNMMLFGRLDLETDRIKQGRLGVVAFARACRDAAEQAGVAPRLRDARLKLFGAAPGDESALRALAEQEAGAALDIHALPFDEDRQALLAELAQASVAVMPSWHEGFGLVGWEAIGAGVPLVVSRKSGLYRFLDEALPGAGTGCVHAVEIRGSEDPELPFQERDVVDISDALKRIAADGERERKKASLLRQLLSEYTWARCARQFVKDVGWEVEPAELPARAATAPPPPEPKPSGAAQENEPSLLVMPQPVWRAGQGHAESLLLLADEACVPFDPGRAQLAEELAAWVRDPEGFPIQVRLHTGGGGAGKTRLALEVCRRLGAEKQAGLEAGFLPSDCSAAEIPSRLRALSRRCQTLLLVVDYAETRRGELAALVKAALSASEPLPRLRILLLARDAGEWWERLAADYPDCERVFAGTATTGPYPLPPLHPELADRGAAYLTALKALAERLGVADVSAQAHAHARPDLSAEHFGSPLYVQMAALLALRGERSGSASGLVDGLLRHEERYWSRLCALHGIPGGGRAAAHLLALATLQGGIATARDARDLYLATGGPECAPAALASLFRSLCELYPGRQGLQPFRPDRLGEGLVSRLLGLADGTRAEIFGALLGSRSNEATRRHTLTVLVRLARQRQEARPHLREAVLEQFIPSIGAIVDVSLETGEPLPETARDAFEHLPPPTRSQAAGLLDERIPYPSVKLALLAHDVAEFRLSSARAAYSRKSNEKASEALARSLGNASVMMENLGQYEEALKLGGEAHVLWAQLAKARPDRYEPHLAKSLSNLDIWLGALGRYEEALERAKESHEIRTRLAKARPDRYEPDLAMSVGNLGSCLGDLGRYEEALERAREAHELYAQLAKARPDRYEPDLAMALNNLGTWLAELGRFEEALEQAKEAHELYARLAKARPDRYEPDLAMSLHNLGDRLACLGRYEEALDRAREAHELYARLAAARSLRYTDDLLEAELSLQLRAWHVGTGNAKSLETWPARVRLAKLRPHRRALLETWHTTLSGWLEHDTHPASTLEKMEALVTHFEQMARHERHKLEDDHLIAAAYLGRHAPTADRAAAYRQAWRDFVEPRRGRVPEYILESLRRLGCKFPPDPE